MDESVEPQAGSVSPFVCATCGRAAAIRSTGWVYFMTGCAGSVETGVYCPNCVEREFRKPAPPSNTQVIECIECARLWDVPTERWRVYVTDDDPPKAIPYCPACSAEEFG
jgi:hypothetical protein